MEEKALRTTNSNLLTGPFLPMEGYASAMQ